MARTIIFWDIDGTLLTTLRAGIKAWEDAVRDVLGVEMDLEGMPTAGLTDRMVAREILTLARHGPDLETESKLGHFYVKALPERLTQRQGYALPGVNAILDSLAARTDVVLALLTGNFRDGAKAKLERYGLNHYFDFGGFGDDGFDRVEIGTVALERACVRYEDLDLESTFLVGDSPYDVACATFLGLKAVAVATGSHTLEELARLNPWWAAVQLPSCLTFAGLLGLKAEDGSA